MNLNNMEYKIKQKLFEIQNSKMSFVKSADNPYFNSKYLPLDKLLKQLQPVLEKHKLLVYHQTEDGTIRTILQDMETMETIESRFPLIPDIEPQKVGSAITYAKRYNIGQIFNIITDADTDGNDTQGKVKYDKRGIVNPKTINTNEDPFID